jgi:hypothetical protein
MVIWKLSTCRPCWSILYDRFFHPGPRQQRNDEHAEHAAQVEDRQPQIFIGRVFLAEVEFEGRAQAMQGEGAGIHLAALDALDGARTDFAAFRQLLLPQAFLLPQFRYF